MFRLVEDSFWDEPQVAELQKDDKLLFICLFTNVHVRPCGIYRITLDRIAHMTGLAVQRVAQGMKLLASHDLAYYNGQEVCIPGFIRRQRYKGPQMARRVAGDLAQVKSKQFVSMILERYGEQMKSGGFRQRQLLSIEEVAPPEAQQEERKPKADSMKQLAEYISERLRFRAGIKTAALRDLVKAEGSEERVRAAVDRAARYYATAKSEKWHSFVIAKRFSKFVEYYDVAFSDDAALDIYIEKIRRANAREMKSAKREAALQVGAQRPEAAPVDPWPDFMQRFPEELEPIKVDFEALRRGKASVMTLELKLLDLFKDNAELKKKTEGFRLSLSKEFQTEAMLRKYKINYIKGKYGIPELEAEA